MTQIDMTDEGDWLQESRDDELQQEAEDREAEVKRQVREEVEE